MLFIFSFCLYIVYICFLSFVSVPRQGKAGPLGLARPRAVGEWGAGWGAGWDGGGFAGLPCNNRLVKAPGYGPGFRSTKDYLELLGK